MFGALPAQLRRTLTWDQGSEMAQHDQLATLLGEGIFFAHPASPVPLRGSPLAEEAQAGETSHHVYAGLIAGKGCPAAQCGFHHGPEDGPYRQQMQDFETGDATDES